MYMFYLRRRLVQHMLGMLLRFAGVNHLVEPPHLCLERNDALMCVRCFGMSKLADILLRGFRGAHHYCVDLINASIARGGWRDVVFAFSIIELGKRDKHERTCHSRGFSSQGSFDPAP